MLDKLERDRHCGRCDWVVRPVPWTRGGIYARVWDLNDKPQEQPTMKQNSEQKRHEKRQEQEHEADVRAALAPVEPATTTSADVPRTRAQEERAAREAADRLRARGWDG